MANGEVVNEVTGEIVLAEPTGMALVERAKLDGAIATAKQWPRNREAVRAEVGAIIVSDLRIAEKAFYCLPPRKKKDGTLGDPITGASVRMAEEILATYGNLNAGVGFAEVDKRAKRVTVRAFVHDMEKNTKVEEEYSVRILWPGDDGEKNALDRARSFAIRNAVFRLFGTDSRMFAEDAMDHVAKTSNVEDVRTKLLEAFGDQDVTEAELLSWCGVAKLEDISAGIIVKLRGLYNAIKDGYTTVQEQFRPSEPEKASANAEDAKEKLKAKQEARETTEPTGAPTAPPEAGPPKSPPEAPKAPPGPAQTPEPAKSEGAAQTPTAPDPQGETAPPAPEPSKAPSPSPAKPPSAPPQATTEQGHHEQGDKDPGDPKLF